MKRTALTLIAATLLSPVALTAPAQAQADKEDFVLRIDSSDLDLTTAKGQDRLQARVRSAVRTACRADGRSLRELTAERECEESTLSNAQRGIDLALAEAVRARRG